MLVQSKMESPRELLKDIMEMLSSLKLRKCLQIWVLLRACKNMPRICISLLEKVGLELSQGILHP